MHHTLYEQLRINTFLLQFYGFLTRGFFSIEERAGMNELIKLNINRLNLMKDYSLDWDGRYDLVTEQLFKTQDHITATKKHLRFKQICPDIEIANYLTKNHNHFFEFGILLNDLKNLLDIAVLFRNGYMLHDIFNGYPEKDLYCYQVDCLDFVHSAAHFYNEAYEYYHGRKEINYDIQHDNNNPYELRRIQPKEEVMFRNFREAYINILFFVESFINSVGFDAYLAGQAKNADEEFNLKGIQSVNPKNKYKKYSNLRQKIENISRILNGTAIDTDLEPYKSYLDNSVELRNQYVHSSPDKGKILLGIEDWKNKCDNMINKECFDFLNAFWTNCYPTKTFPKVIFNVFWGNSFKGHQGKLMATE
jgi:hypothetical protein